MTSICIEPGAGPSHGLSAFARKLAEVTLATCVATLVAACGGGEDNPAITIQPVDRVVIERSAATFVVAADGAVPLSYQWASSPDGASFTPIAGATDAAYFTGPTVHAQNGTRYQVTVSNHAGSVTSNAAHLAVLSAVSP